MSEVRHRHARLLERLQEAAESESVAERARQWRNRPDEERWRAFVGLMRMSDFIARNRPQRYVKPDLSFPRISSARHAGR